MSEVGAAQAADQPEISFDGDPLALERQVCFALAVASRSVIALYRPLLEPLGLTHPQYLVMLALWQRTPRSVKELSAVLQLDAGTLSPLLKRLEAAGLLVRQRDAGDERALAVTLTERGTALREQALRIPEAVVRRLGMSLAELQHLHESLTRVIAAANAGDPDSGERP
ncbi:MarR family winged helix-turn-helix transcriptional regulator [Goodfellowiella coeruleoviolacea]|uniref:Transcriptional regulator, MarR family n=1 Tax=Goodfellowiella coeruleoviolacea TaxID=334858 RepID=A0AAE3GCX2_9PSEU|nr:MarR family transcriptional regulator [Goodfellowiella coeruleoviolacea]MCP2164879.1 transcriptional regulator, MarR family [Goodfellowiella coeruleoviolacea]